MLLPTPNPNHLFLFCRQKTNLVALWRNLHIFLGCNVGRSAVLVDKLRVLAAGKQEKEVPFRPSVWKEVAALMPEDYVAVGDIIMGAQSLSAVQLHSHLRRLKTRRLLSWHIYSAPAHLVDPRMSMFFSNDDSSLIFFSLPLPRERSDHSATGRQGGSCVPGYSQHWWPSLAEDAAH